MKSWRFINKEDVERNLTAFLCLINDDSGSICRQESFNNLHKAYTDLELDYKSVQM